MLTQGALARAIKQNDWFTSVDLKDAFFHISIYPPHRKFLRFAYQGICYEFTVLPFGLSLSPRSFCLCAEAGLAPLRISGLRILTYIDDWLIIAESKEKVLQDTDRVLAHITSLGFQVNVSKSNFTPSQNVIFLGLELNSVSMRARLSQERVRSLMNCLTQFREGAKVQYRTCLRLQGLMASSTQVVPLGLLRMRAFMKWVLSLHFSPIRDLCRSVTVTRACSATLRHWERENFYARGTPLGAVTMRKVVTTDASLTGWGATQEGRTVNGLWPNRLRSAHINYLELLTIWKALNHFLPRLQGHHVLVRCDNTTAVAYINRQGGMRSSKLHALAYTLEQTGFPVVTRNSRSGHSEQRCGSAIKGKPNLRRMASSPSDSGNAMDEIRTGERRSIRLARKLPLSYVLLSKGHGRAPRGRRTGPPMAQSAPVCFSSPVPDNSLIGQGERAGPVSHSDSTQVAQGTMAGRDNSSVIRRAVAPSRSHGSIVPSQRGDLPPPPGQGGSLGLARERTNLNALGLSPRVVATIQNARAVSTRSLYGCKWHVFEGWCDGRGLTSYQCSVPDILCFLQDLMEKGRSFSTIKVYLAAISACHVGFEGSTVGQHPLIRRFMKGARRSLPVIRRTVPEWDLSMVLEALSQHPFEPLGSISLKLLSFKTALLLALASAKRVSELHALSVHPSCTKFSLSGDKVSLKPNPAFMPKCFPAFTSEVLELSAFHPPPFTSLEDQRLNALCPVRALQAYMTRTSAFRKSDQLFVSWAPPHRGSPISKQRLSHWVVGAKTMAYEAKGVQPPRGIRAHSTRGLAASWALFRGVSLQDICSAASWASPHTFVRYYRLDVTRTSVAHSVLGVGSS
ncbi:uncharacterized protein LOC130072339 [Rhinichthys klamathensis goyatoka]|uniref:uncharacterized protein LOC130072339 n=1 Tax=Rhinichthys klamathensis goyatoka TaxID=3034132 RepID=UPI0024B610D9|nr:uncharacterized protein LOC130072339 [Rhinichthys klamathensis goyatoka]